jgi:hypothetical protein
MADETNTPISQAACDDSLRTWIARATLITDFLLLSAIIYLMFFRISGINKDVLPWVTGTIGSILGWRGRDAGTVYNYMFGSSAGSTAKSIILAAKDKPNG